MNRNEKKKSMVLCVCAAFAFMFLCHGFMLMNPSYNHDSLNEIVRDDGMFQATLGRFLQSPFRAFFSRVTASWYIGCITAALIGMTAWFVSDLLQLKKPLSGILLAGLLTTNYTVINSVAVYMPWLDTYGAELFFAALAVWLTRRYRFGFAAGILCVVPVLGLYPPYILCIPAFVFLWLMFSLRQKGWKTRLLFIGKNICMLAVGYGIYRLILAGVLQAKHLAYAETDNSITAIGLPLSEIPLSFLISITCRLFFSQLVTTIQYSQYPVPALVFLGASFLIAFVAYLRHTKATLPEAVCAALLLAVTPLVFNFQLIVCIKGTYHPLMIYSIYLAFVYFILFYEAVPAEQENEKSTKPAQECAPLRKTLLSKKNRARILSAVAAAAVILVLFCDIRYANNVYTDKYMKERITLSFMTRVMGQAEQTEGFIPQKTPILFVGHPSDNPLLAEDDAFYPVMGEWLMKTSITYNIQTYLKNYLGYSNPYAGAKTQQALADHADVKKMPCYPASGFARMVEGCLVIKLSE